jgi:AcrR family transcriptional regulator
VAQRVGLDRGAVVAAAIDVVDRDGIEALTLANVARALGVQTPSLYSHVNGLAALRRLLWLWAVNDFAAVLRSAVLARSGDEALFSFAVAYREYAARHPGRYQLTLAATTPGDLEMERVSRDASEAFRAVIRSFGIDSAQARRVGRAIRAALHGFVSLEQAHSMVRDDELDDSFETMVGLLSIGLRPQLMSAAGGRAR